MVVVVVLFRLLLEINLCLATEHQCTRLVKQLHLNNFLGTGEGQFGDSRRVYSVLLPLHQWAAALLQH